jgi:hypothetical protein
MSGRRRSDFKGAPLLGVVGVAIIGAPDPADNVAEAALGVIGINASPAHQGARRSTQIMDSPIREAAFLVEGLFELVEGGQRP